MQNRLDRFGIPQAFAQQHNAQCPAAGLFIVHVRRHPLIACLLAGEASERMSRDIAFVTFSGNRRMQLCQANHKKK